MKATTAWLVAAALLLAGCGGTATASPSEEGTATRPALPSATEPGSASSLEEGSLAAETRIDEQGAVTFDVTPLDLDSPGDTIDFEIVMDTHSVDLGWDLAAQAVLRTHTDLEVQGAGWPVGTSHHHSGTLSFPARTAEGVPILDGAGTLTLLIRDTEVSERAFVWVLAP